MPDPKLVDHFAFTDYRLHRRYVFETDRLVDGEKLTRFVLASVRRKQSLASFLPETLNFLYSRIPDEITSEFNVGVTCYVNEYWYF